MQKSFPTPSDQDSTEHFAVEDHVDTLLSRAPPHPVPGATPQEIHYAIWALATWKAAGPNHVLSMCLR